MPKNWAAKTIRRDAKLLDRAVTTYFEPIAKEHKLPLVRIQDGIYEMPSAYFILRIEAYAGHSNRSVGVSLRKTSLRAFVERVVGFNYGITWYMRLNNENIKQFNFLINSDEDFLKMAQLYADATERFGKSYLLGLKDDFYAVTNFVQEQSEPTAERMRRAQRDIEQNMKNVRQEWPVVVPREKGDEWQTVKELKTGKIQFLGNLDGDKEQAFKEKFSEAFKQNRNLRRAYLARIIGPELPANGALCLLTQSSLDKGTVEEIGKVFADIFGLQDNFNLILLTDEKESAVSKVCQPFFVNT